MAALAFLSLSVSIGLWLLSLIFKVAGKTRLTLPVLYFLVAVISTFFTDWTSKHETLVLFGLFILVALVVLSWIFSLVKVIQNRRQDHLTEEYISWQIHQAREMGIPIETVTFDENNNLIDPRTGKPVAFKTGR